ncbi:MAG: flagellar export chaperone FliS [Gammaproteobacteria bacterium]
MESYKVYSEIEVNTEVMTASRHRLIQLLFNRCLEHIKAARVSIRNKEIPKKHKSVSKAMDIIHHLRACLDTGNEETKEISTLLTGIYNFFEKCLIKASLKNDLEYLEHVETVLTSMKSAWDAIASEVVEE